MKTFIALLRGINVSGKHIIKMNDLVFQLASLNYKNIKTYIQSGNIIFETTEKQTEIIEKEISTKILKEFGFEVPVLVISREKLLQVFENNPFVLRKSLDINNLYITFLSVIPSDENIAKLNGFKDEYDEFILSGDVVYLHIKNGYGRTKLNNTFFENRLKVSATTRNWKTVVKLVEMVY